MCEKLRATEISQSLLTPLGPVEQFVSLSPTNGHSTKQLQNLVDFMNDKCIDTELEAGVFFYLAENVYTFLASAHWWNLLLTALSAAWNTEGTYMEHLPETRWSERADAYKALKLGFFTNKNLLAATAADCSETPQVSAQTRSLWLDCSMERLETGILLIFWDNVMTRYNYTNVTPQKSDQSLNTTL